jgi:hypothetical protein
MNTAPRTDQPESTVILEALFEGGSLTVFGIKAASGWRFKVAVDEGTMFDLLSDEDRAGMTPSDFRSESDWVESWEAALALLNERWWHMTSPRQVHPDFRQRIWVAVQERAARKGGEHHARWVRCHLDQWKRVCRGEPLFSGHTITLGLPRR